MKLNKTHEGKEFRSYFRFIGQVKQTITGTSDNFKIHPIFDTTTTKTNKPRRVLQFDVLTNKFNNMPLQLAGMEKDFVYLFSSTEKKSHKIKWADRLNKKKYPNDSYHYMKSEWDLSEEIAGTINEGDWVEVKGKYEFGKFVNDEGKEFPVIKRFINSVEKVENGQEIVLRDKKTKIIYVTDFESPEFVEVNEFNLEVGIKSVYQDEDTKDVIVNGVFLDYGKEKSTPRDIKLTIPYKEAVEGKLALADAFTRLNEYDFIEVVGTDNNRPIFAEVEPDDEEEDLFADVDETVAQTRMVISGNKKGLEISSVVKGTHQKKLLTEEEFTPFVEPSFEDMVDSDVPFPDDEEIPDFMKED